MSRQKKKSQFRSPTQNQDHFNPNTEINSVLISTLTLSQFWGPDAKNQSISTNHTKNKSIPIPTLKSSQFRSPHWNQVNFDHPHKNKSVEPSLKQVILGPHTQTKSISMWSPHWNQVNFYHPHIKQVRRPLNHSRSAHRKQINFDAPTQKPSNYDPSRQ